MSGGRSDPQPKASAEGSSPQHAWTAPAYPETVRLSLYERIMLRSLQELGHFPSRSAVLRRAFRRFVEEEIVKYQAASLDVAAEQLVRDIEGALQQERTKDEPSTHGLAATQNKEKCRCLQ
jgi:Arc/MetJ-type ribon-helix-helix transcriptional regulator